MSETIALDIFLRDGHLLKNTQKKGNGKMKRLSGIVAMVLCIVLTIGMLGGCGSGSNTQNESSKANVNTEGGGDRQSPTTETEKDIAKENKERFYNEAVRVGYTESFKYVTKGYTVGSGEGAEEVNYFMDLVREKFPNAEFEKIEDPYDAEAIIAAGYDVVFGLNTYALQALKSSSGLKEYKPVWADETGANLNDSDNQYFAVAKDMILSAYRKTGTPDDSADVEKQKDKETFGGIEISGVESVQDLWKDGSAYVGKYELDRYAEGWDEVANKTFLAGLLSSYIDKNAESTDFVSQEGWDQLQAMIDGRSAEWVNAEETKNVCATGDFINNIARTQISLDYATDAIDKMAWYWAAGKCARLDVIEYSSVPTFIYGAAIMAGTTKVEASQLFMDYIGASDTVYEMAKHVRTLIPANKNVFTEANVRELDENGSGAEYKDYTAAIDAEGNKIVRIIPTRQYMFSVVDMEAQEIDWDFVCEHMDAWVARANAMTEGK